MKAEALVRDWLDDMELTRNLSENTLRRYRRAVTEALDVLELENLQDLEAVGRGDVVEWTRCMRERGLATGSIYNNRCAFKQFMKWLIETEHVGCSPVTAMRNVKVPKTIPQHLSKEQVERLIEAPLRHAKNETWQNHRDRAAIAFLYYTGARASEAAGLRMCDLDLRGRWVFLHGKGDKERSVPIAAPLHAILSAYLKGRDKTSKGYVFESQRGGPMGRRGLFHCVTRWAERAGLPDGVGCHTLRHSIATHLVSSGMSIRYVQKMLGHASITTTERYVAVENQDLQRAFDASL